MLSKTAIRSGLAPHEVLLMPLRGHTAHEMLPCGLKASVQVDLAIYRSMLNENLSE